MDGHKIYGHDRLEGGREGGGSGERLINLSVCIKTVVAQEEAKESVSIYIFMEQKGVGKKMGLSTLFSYFWAKITMGPTKVFSVGPHGNVLSSMRR